VIKQVDGVMSVHADYKTGQVRIVSPPKVTEKALRDAIESAGFKLVRLETQKVSATP